MWYAIVAVLFPLTLSVVIICVGMLMQARADHEFAREGGRFDQYDG